MVKIMKKSLAVVLCLAACLSLFCIPASALYAETPPYMLCTYEDGAINFASGSNLTGTIVEGGVGGSGHALQLTTGTGSYTEFYIKDKNEAYVAGTIPAGSTYVVSFWVKAVTEISNFDFHLYDGPSYGNYITSKVKGDVIDGWQKITLTIAPAEDKTLTYWRFRQNFVGTYLIDDFEISLVDADDAPASSNIAVIGNATEGNEVTFIHTFTPATSSASGVTDTSLVRLVNVTSAGARGIIAVCGINETMTIPTLPADSASIEFEVVPLSSDGKAGQVVKYTPPEPTVYAKTLPYILCTYEDDVINFASGANPTGTIVEGGVGSSGHALQLETGTGSYTEFYIKDKDNQYATGTISAGVNYTVSFWAKPVTEIASMDFHLYDGPSYGNYVSTKTKSEPTADGWVKYTLVCTRDTDTTITYWRFRQNFVGTYLIDDFEVSIVKPSDAPASSNFAVTGDVAAGNRIAFAHTFTPATSSASGVTDTSLVRLVNTTSTGERAVIGICGINETMLVPATPANSARMEFEVVPMSSDSKVGQIATYAISSGDAIEGITIERVSGDEITVATDTELSNAQLIFVTYDANNKMVDYEVVNVDLEAQGTDSFSPVNLTAGSYTKVMLWFDMTACKPLADMIQY